MTDKPDLIIPIPQPDDPVRSAIDYAITLAKLNGCGVRFTLFDVTFRVTADDEPSAAYRNFMEGLHYKRDQG